MATSTFKDLLPPTPPRSGSDTSSTGTLSGTTSSKATPPHLRQAGAVYRKQSELSPTRNMANQVLSSRAAHGPFRQPAVTSYQPFRPTTNISRPGRAPPNALELRVALQKVPRSWSTWDIYTYFNLYGNITRVDIRERRTLDLYAIIVFQPAPKDISWLGRPLNVSDPDGYQRVMEAKNIKNEMHMHRSTHDPSKYIPERMVVPLAEVHFGTMKSESEFLSLHSVESVAKTDAEISMNLQYKEINLAFPVNGRAFRFQFTPAQVSQAFQLAQQDGSHSILLLLDSPPLAWRKSNNLRATHDDEATLWSDRQAWFRQTDIDSDPTSRERPVELPKTDCIVDIGRWLVYRLKFSAETVASPDYRHFCQALANHNIVLVGDKNISISYGEPHAVWSWLDERPLNGQGAGGSSISALQELDEASYYLPFKLRYQLEVCLSFGALQECNIDKQFLQRLAAMDTARAIKVLEKVADNKVREYNPMNILKLQNQVSVVEKKRPAYCTKIPSLVITPTSIYPATPVLETSNRVIRQFQQHEDRFLRVKFTDERYKGKIWSTDDNRMNEVFSRIKRAMTHGIQIGDRHYEFLAFGNSQFREHGAYFFASTVNLSAEMIRQWMGRFSQIRVIAKYVSRLGQCFSTTRAIPHRVSLDRIDDIERNGHCFTDGAGKMSPLLARMIACHHGLPNSDQSFPSAVQFRLAGCKGVLAVEPSLKGLEIRIRPSQEKFPAEFLGLEVCRISQFSTANLNMQIILVLSALGIDDEVFLGKMRAMLVDIKEAMSNEHKALELLQKNIDYNQTTILLATMIFDGFMECKDPFMITCLRLWRSWCLKYLKEKARIYVDQGFFGLAIPDETETLRGHYNKVESDGSSPVTEDPDAANGHDDLPEIFLQVPDPAVPGKYRVVEAICILARNPSLHPGDVRKVRAVDKPELRHLRNVVVIPTTGDRDLANMCSGGDLDGDDFMVIWDPDFLFEGESHAPMDYTSPDPVMSEGPVSVDDMTNFFVKHIKNDNLSSIAVAHRYWADRLEDGVKDPKCIELAQLHSKAVDYPKTGVPAVMRQHLKVEKWPHWCEPKNKAKDKIYKSNRVLGKLYDEVKKEPFHAAWELPFDQRILTACEPSEQMLDDAREVKALYDEAVQRIMTQHGIKTEFEVWTTFVLDHHQEIGDYKFAETMSTVTSTLLEQHRELCYEKAGVQHKTKAVAVAGQGGRAAAQARISEKANDDEKMDQFIVAMYKVTEEQVAIAYEEAQQVVQKGGRDVPLRPLTFKSMPFMSFPWIFARELGQLATKGKTKASLSAMPRPTMPTKAMAKVKLRIDLLGDDFELPALPETSLGIIPQQGEVLDIFHKNTTMDKMDSRYQELDSHFDEIFEKRHSSVKSPSDLMEPNKLLPPPTALDRQPLAQHEKPDVDIPVKDSADLVEPTKLLSAPASPDLQPPTQHEKLDNDASLQDVAQNAPVEDGVEFEGEEGAEQPVEEFKIMPSALDKKFDELFGC